MIWNYSENGHKAKKVVAFFKVEAKQDFSRLKNMNQQIKVFE
jgi:hypothetical protein